MSHLERFREWMVRQDWDAALVTSGENVFYVSGFTGYGDGCVLVTGEDAYLFTDSRYALQAAEQCPEMTVRICGSNRQQELRNLAGKRDFRTIAFENKRIPYADFQSYFSLFGLDEEQWRPLDDTLERLRSRKEPDELVRIRQACRIACQAYEKLLPRLRPGLSEQEAAAELEYLMRKEGAEKTSFDTIVASGLRGAMPHGTATAKRLEKGQGITLDFGAVFQGYCSDMTRTVFLGQPSPELRRIYQVVLDAQEKAISGYRPGMTGKDVDAIARQAIGQAGYGEYFGHGLGHGVGVEIHEEPSLSFRGETVLEEGMVFSIEPGIYVPGTGGVRIEDLVTPVAGRLEILTGVSKALTVL